ncbi:MAG: winged helix-turn-helix transcriptional regulator [Clostridia bacterium]|nr:winged helix-turn-helix transcriptional regulator [Clostridia bacterium]
MSPKLSVVYYIIQGNWRYENYRWRYCCKSYVIRKEDELWQKYILSAKVLTENLREMENDGIINRKTYAVVPPKVEYSLSAKGEELKPIIDLMKEFGNKYKDKK